jgi:hypothetical protein
MWRLAHASREMVMAMPHRRVIHLAIPMHQCIPHGDRTSKIRQFRRDVRRVPQQPVERLTDNFELTLHSVAQILPLRDTAPFPSRVRIALPMTEYAASPDLQGAFMSVFSFDPLTAVAVAVATAATDAVYVMFTSAVAARKRVPAASWSSLWYLLSSYAVISYTENWLYVCFAAAGSWLGAFASVTFLHRPMSRPLPGSAPE